MMDIEKYEQMKQDYIQKKGKAKLDKTDVEEIRSQYIAAKEESKELQKIEDSTFLQKVIEYEQQYLLLKLEQLPNQLNTLI